MDFYGDNVRLLRVFAGKTQLELARDVSVSEAAIWQFERGREPSDTVRDALAITLKVKPEFFSERLPDELTERNCNFRKGSSSVEKVRKRVLAQGSLFAHVAVHLRDKQKLSLPKFNVPCLSAATFDEVELVAESCRKHWQLGDGPIGNMARVLENAGVMITRLKKDDGTKLDAFSHQGSNGSLSFVVLNPSKGSTSRARFDMAHELAHLALHHQSPLGLKEKEAQADRFASAFLVPRSAVMSEFRFGRRFDLDHILELKKRWKMSAQAIVYRAFDLRLINAVEFRRAYKLISARHWLREEPFEPQREVPEMFRNARQTLWQRKKIGTAQIADSLHWFVETFEGVTEYRSSTATTEPDGVMSLVHRRPRMES